MTKSLEEDIIEKLNKAISDRDKKIKELLVQLQNSNDNVAPETASVDLLLLLTDYQVQVARLEEEHREYLKVIQRLSKEKKKLEKITGKIELDELEEKSERLEKERNELSGENKKLKSKIPELQEKLDILAQIKEEKEILEIEFENLTKKVSQLKPYESKCEVLEKDKEEFVQKVETLEGRVETLKDAEKQVYNLTHKNFDLKTEVQGLKSQLEQKQNELNELLELIQFQAEKIKLLESDLSSNQAFVADTTLSSNSTTTQERKHFEFDKDKFIKVSKKSEGVNLEFNALKRKWIVTIGTKVSLVEKNKALRLVRALPTSGKKMKNGELIGKGFDLMIIGE